MGLVDGIEETPGCLDISPRHCGGRPRR